MSFEDAAAALEGAIEADNSPTPSEQAPAPTTPEGESAPDSVQPHHAAQQLRDDHGRFVVPGQETEEPAAPVEDTFDGGQFNPDTLPAELQDGWKQLQAAYTRKTQEVAEQRKQFEGLDPAQAREALELYQQLQNPDYLVQFHRELSQALEANGLTRAEANAAAAEMTREAAAGSAGPATPESDALSALREYPELAGVADYLKTLEDKSSTALTRIEEWEQQQALREEQAMIRQNQMALAAEVQRQEAAIIAANRDNPNFTLETTPEMESEGRISDLDAIYSLSGQTDGNLIAAAELYQRIINSAASSYFGAKQSASELPAPVPSNASQTSEVPVLTTSLEEGHRAAEEYLRGAGITELD